MSITILGAGIAGTSLAWALARRGRRDVVVLDPFPTPQGSTAKALGGFRTQHGSELNIRLSLASRAFFEERADRIHFQPNGYLYLAETPAVAAELARRAEMQASCGLGISHPDAHELLPWLETSDIHGTNFCALDGLYIPLDILACLREESAALGVVFAQGSRPPRPAGGGEIVVIACGIWSPGVGKSLGVDLQVEAIYRRVHITGPYDWLGDRVPMTLEAGSGFHFRERECHLWVMGPGDQNDWTRVRDWLAMRAPRAAVAEPAAVLDGYYEMSFDHHPLVGKTTADGVWSSCGFSGHGVMHAPAIADALAAMINGDTPTIDISALNPLRTDPLVDSTQL